MLKRTGTSLYGFRGFRGGRTGLWDRHPPRDHQQRQVVPQHLVPHVEVEAVADGVVHLLRGAAELERGLDLLIAEGCASLRVEGFGQAVRIEEQEVPRLDRHRV